MAYSSYCHYDPTPSTNPSPPYLSYPTPPSTMSQNCHPHSTTTIINHSLARGQPSSVSLRHYPACWLVSLSDSLMMTPMSLSFIQ